MTRSEASADATASAPGARPEDHGLRRGPSPPSGDGPPLPGDLPGRDYERLGPKVWFFGALMVLVGAVTACLIWVKGQGVRASHSYLYLVFYAVPANTAISVFPHEPVVIFFGEFADVWITAAAATVGTLAAAYMDHTVFTPVLNLEGRQAYKEKKLYRKAAGWFARYPFATLVAAGATPVPFWPFKFLSFSVHYPLRKYLAAVTVARFPRYVVLAWIGLYLDPPTWLLVALFLGVLATYLVKAGPAVLERWRYRRTAADGGEERSPAEMAPAGEADG